MIWYWTTTTPICLVCRSDRIRGLGFLIHLDDGCASLYYDDGKGNGDGISTGPSVTEAMKKAEEVEAELYAKPYIERY
jgi:hypothetical protein